VVTMKKHTIGNAPISENYRAVMNSIGEGIDRAFNGDHTGSDRTTGFVLLVFPFYAAEGRCNYIAMGKATHSGTPEPEE